jgi:hypothetical protein
VAIASPILEVSKMAAESDRFQPNNLTMMKDGIT